MMGTEPTNRRVIIRQIMPAPEMLRATFEETQEHGGKPSVVHTTRPVVALGVYDVVEERDGVEHPVLQGCASPLVVDDHSMLVPVHFAPGRLRDVSALGPAGSHFEIRRQAVAR